MQKVKIHECLKFNKNGLFFYVRKELPIKLKASQLPRPMILIDVNGHEEKVIFTDYLPLKSPFVPNIISMMLTGQSYEHFPVPKHSKGKNLAVYTFTKAK